MKEKNSTLALTICLLGIALILQFQATNYYFWGAPPTGFSLGTLGLIIVIIGVIISSLGYVKN